MDNHPIPQDVTGFQFKLIGDMTIKQFGYVAAGCVIAFVFFYFPISPFIKIPLALVSAIFGLALAFLPVEGRPFDTMAGFFIKALITPNQYAYHKVGGNISLFDYQIQLTTTSHNQPATQGSTSSSPIHDPTKQAKLETYLQTLHQQPQASQPIAPLQPIPQPFISTPPQPKAPLTANVPQVSKEEEEANLSLQAATLKHELDEVKQQETQEKDKAKLLAEQQHEKEIQTRLSVILQEKEALEKELQALQQKPVTIAVPEPVSTVIDVPKQTIEQVAKEAQATLAQAQQPAPTQSPSPAPIVRAAPVATAQPTIHTVPADLAKSIGLPHMPEVPNLIIGIIKDSRGNVLSNILVEVKDKDGTPARAFRTNTLGQFASSTQLANGTYMLEFEDPKGQHTFDTIELVAKNEILLPLEIISHDAREELRKELFS